MLKQTHFSKEIIPGSGQGKIKEKSSLLVKSTTENNKVFSELLWSLRDAPTTFLDGSTRELIVLMSPVAERILDPPELKVTSGTTRCSAASAWLQSSAAPPEVWIHVIIQSRHLVITNGQQRN